jgi:hypothetical protein
MTDKTQGDYEEIAQRVKEKIGAAEDNFCENRVELFDGRFIHKSVWDEDPFKDLVVLSIFLRNLAEVNQLDASMHRMIDRFSGNVDKFFFRDEPNQYGSEGEIFEKIFGLGKNLTAETGVKKDRGRTAAFAYQTYLKAYSLNHAYHCADGDRKERLGKIRRFLKGLKHDNWPGLKDSTIDPSIYEDLFGSRITFDFLEGEFLNFKPWARWVIEAAFTCRQEYLNTRKHRDDQKERSRKALDKLPMRAIVKIDVKDDERLMGIINKENYIQFCRDLDGFKAVLKTWD